MNWSIDQFLQSYMPICNMFPDLSGLHVSFRYKSFFNTESKPALLMSAFSFGEKPQKLNLVENLEMKSIKFPLVYLTFILLAAQFLFSSNSGGVYGKSTSGCGGAGCHQNSPNTVISLTGIPAAGYVNGTTYPITLTVSNPTKSEAGFNLTVNQGTLAAGTGMSANGAQELKHTQPQVMTSNAATWIFNWTAPATGTNPVIFFIAGNAVDGNNNSSNDEFETTQAQFSSASSSSAPTISSVNANVISSSAANISANINANGDPASVSIQYGLTMSYGSSMNATPAVVTGSVATPISAALTGLLPSTLYHYRVVATNSLGTTQSSDGVFTTMPSSVSDIESSKIRVYPNPAAHQLIVEDVSKKPVTGFVLFDAIGNRYPVRYTEMEKGKYILSLEGMARGYYLLMASQEANYFRYTIIKE